MVPEKAAAEKYTVVIKEVRGIQILTTKWLKEKCDRFVRGMRWFIRCQASEQIKYGNLLLPKIDWSALGKQVNKI